MEDKPGSFIIPNIFWQISIENSEKIYVDKLNATRSPWLDARDTIRDSEETVKSLVLCKVRKAGGFCIGSLSNKEAYFFSNRASLNFGDGSTITTYGIGYLENSIVKITWFNSELEAVQFEERNVEQCRETLIFRNIPVISSQA